MGKPKNYAGSGSPFVIKVRKMSSDEWHIESNGEVLSGYHNDFNEKKLARSDNSILTASVPKKFTSNLTSSLVGKSQFINERDPNLSVACSYMGDKGQLHRGQYLCKTCLVSSSSLLTFLRHIEMTHFRLHNAESSPRETERGNENNINCISHVNSDPNGKSEKESLFSLPITNNGHQDNCEKMDKELGTSQELCQPNRKEAADYSVKQECDLSHLPGNNEYSFTHQGCEISESIFGTFATKSSGDSSDKHPENRTCALQREDFHDKGVDLAFKKEVLTCRGAKINSIANTLKECTSALPDNFRQTSTDAQSFQYDIHGEVSSCGKAHAQVTPCEFDKDSCSVTRFPDSINPMNGSTVKTFPYKQTLFSQRESDISINYPPCNQVSGFSNHYSHTTHFTNLQPLVTSGRVSMPETAILQSIDCGRGAWDCVQNMLHKAFCIFPYLNVEEAHVLSDLTGLTTQQVKTLFVVARLQHGITWDLEEIANAREYLGVPKNRYQAPARYFHLTKEQREMLKRSFRKDQFSTQELNRLAAFTGVDERTVIWYFNHFREFVVPTSRYG